jgi:hypothetical protein
MAELEHVSEQLSRVEAMLRQLLQQKPEPIEPLIPLKDAAEALIVGKRSSKAKQQAMYHRLRTEHYREGKEVFKVDGRWMFDLQACQKRDRTPARKR